MTYGEYSQWVKDKPRWESRLKRCLEGSNRFIALVRLRDDFVSCEDIHNNAEANEFYSTITALLKEVA